MPEVVVVKKSKPDTGFVRLLKHWVVDDCGRMINPLLVEEQLRGGVTQGIGAALFENCIYDDNGQLCNGNLADYLVPMAGEIPEIVCGHVETPTRMSKEQKKLLEEFRSSETGDECPAVKGFFTRVREFLGA